MIQRPNEIQLSLKRLRYLLLGNNVKVTFKIKNNSIISRSSDYLLIYKFCKIL